MRVAIGAFLVVPLLIAGVLALVVLLSPRGAPQHAPDSAEPGVRLQRRWHARVWWWRAVSGVVAATGAIVLGMAVNLEFHVGVGVEPVWSNPLITGLAGSFGGAIAAELHHLRPRGTRRRTASLQPRDPRSYAPPANRGRLVGVAAVAVVVAALSLTSAQVDGVPWPTVVALAVVGVAAAVQRVVVLRPRPALPPALHDADDLVRRAAVSSLGYAGAGVGLLLALVQGARFLEREVGAAPVTGAVTLAGFVLALVWWRRSSPHRLLTHDDAAPVHAEERA